RAAKLVQSFKQVSVDQTSGERRVFKLAGYIEEVLASLSPKLKNRPITLSVDCPGDLECDTHPGALAQILTNLVMNALIHAFAETEPGTIRISAHSDANDTILLTFADDGKGIAIQDLPKIFDPFFTTRRGSGGTGLGLHIVHNLVVASLQGSIEVTSQSGTAFHIRFPARTTL
ncbi:MAG TPA: HAMP domain-containing histidine kinase, partial [Rhodospirillaceae bacterium]|nr:HAMP domain-containing histidine kinase [Rhodospirillaceae bacterium]